MKLAHISAIILAAGYSSRMGRFKPLLPLGGTTVAGRVANLYRSAGIHDICMVAGHRADALRDALQSIDVRWVINPQYANGMYSSLVAGLRDLPHGCKGFFVHPVDLPLVRRSTLAALIGAFDCYPADILHPCFEGKRGHPPLVPAALALRIRTWPGKGGLQAFWRAANTPMRDLNVADEGILLDLDTEADFMRASALVDHRDLPTAAECRSLLQDVLVVPAAVQAHGRAVAGAALKMAAALIPAGIRLDRDLIRAAALLHDIARDRPNHAAAGAELLEKLDYPRVAAAVRTHMDMKIDPDQAPDEAGIVFLADKLIVGHRLAGLEERFGRKRTKYGTDAEALAAIDRRWRAARTILRAVERLSGRTVQAILSDPDGNEKVTP